MANASCAERECVRLIMEHDDVYINEDVTYRSDLLQHINTIITKVYNGRCDRIALEIHYKNNGVLVNLNTPPERYKAQ